MSIIYFTHILDQYQKNTQSECCHSSKNNSTHKRLRFDSIQPFLSLLFTGLCSVCLQYHFLFYLNKIISLPRLTPISMDNHLTNPFTQSRISIPTSNSLLTYGEDSLSFFSRLQTSSTRNRSQTVYLTQRQTEERIINRIQKEMYAMDESGRCLAEQLLDDMITQDGEKEQDFWQKIKVTKPKKQIQNPFSSQVEKSNLVKKASFSQKTTVSRIRRSQEITNPKTSRHSARLEMVKLKDIIKKEKQKQGEKQGKEQKFSLVNMYRNKRQVQVAAASTHQLSQIKTEPQRTEIKYPQLITFKDTIYLRVELQN